MNIKRSRIVAIMTLILALLAVFASLEGLLNKNIYQDVQNTGAITNTLVRGSIAQDIVSIPLGIILAALSILFIKYKGYKTFIAMLGLTGNFFYGYGLYVIQGQYTSIYLVYLAIFSLSIYGLIFGLASFERDTVEKYVLSKDIRIVIGIFMGIIILILAPGWLGRMSTDIEKHLPGETYSVYILDLCIVFPALGYITVQLLRNKPFASTFAGIALFKILTVCLSWGFGQWFVLIYDGSKPDTGLTAISTTLTLISLMVIIIYILKLKRREITNG